MKSAFNHIRLIIVLLISLIPSLLLADYYASGTFSKGKIKIGTLATIDEVCKLIDHPVFTIKQEDSGIKNPRIFRLNMPYTYLFIPIDNEIKKFKSMFPSGYYFLGRDKKDASKMMDRISHFPECFKSRNIGEIPNSIGYDSYEQEKYNVKANYPLIQWTQEEPRRLDLDYYSNLYGAQHLEIRLSGFREHTCIGCIFFLKEMHSTLLKRFDELYAVEVVRLKTEAARKAALQIREEEERVRQEAFERKEAEKIRLEALSLLKKQEAEELRLQKIASIEEEKLRLEQIRIQQKAESERLKLQIQLEKEQENRNLIILIVAFIISIFVASYFLQKRKERNEQAIELENLQLARKEQEKKEKAEKVKSSKTRWENKGKKIQKQIQDIQSNINEIEKLEDDLKAQIQKTEIEKKSIEESIDNLKDEIKNEKKVVKRLRERYPFIDSYIDNR